MENMENVVAINEVADVASAGNGGVKTAAMIGAATVVAGGIGFAVYKGVKKIKSAIAAKKAARAEEAECDCEE